MRRTNLLFQVAAFFCLAWLMIACGSERAPVEAQPAVNSPVSNPTRASQPTATARPAQINGMRTIALEELPPEAVVTLALIEKGGPFPYRQDGQVFQNRERILPQKASGYYHEYTVETPGENDRGARRIVTGDGGESYYTDDHYESFRVILLP